MVFVIWSKCMLVSITFDSRTLFTKNRCWWVSCDPVRLTYEGLVWYGAVLKDTKACRYAREEEKYGLKATLETNIIWSSYPDRNNPRSRQTEISLHSYDFGFVADYLCACRVAAASSWCGFNIESFGLHSSSALYLIGWYRIISETLKGQPGDFTQRGRSFSFLVYSPSSRLMLTGQWVMKVFVPV